jgi:hypothetical protein
MILSGMKNPIEFKSNHGIRLLGSHRFVLKVSNALNLVAQSSEFMDTCRNVHWIIQSRFCIAANRVSRRLAFGRIVHLDLASTRTSAVALASFLVNEAKWIDLKYQASLASRLTQRWLKGPSKELDNELICLQFQIYFLKMMFPDSPLIPMLEFNSALLKERKFFHEICYWLEENC